MSRIQPKTQRSIIAHKSTCAPSGSIPRTGYTKKHSSISWSVSGDTRGNLPRAKKQSTGLFFVCCGALPCSIPRTKYTKKHSSTSWSVFLVTRAGIELLSFYKYPLMQYVLTIILSLVWISLKGIFISVWYKVWYSSYKKCGTAPACKNK